MTADDANCAATSATGSARYLHAPSLLTKKGTSWATFLTSRPTDRCLVVQLRYNTDRTYLSSRRATHISSAGVRRVGLSSQTRSAARREVQQVV